MFLNPYGINGTRFPNTKINPFHLLVDIVRGGHMMRAAEKMSVQRHMKNMNRIERAADRMAGRKRDGVGR